ncbi:MAG: DMT family transporter [Anaerolineae bacterium]|nr:DMT family transporter [Anaerolineae bacterium]
MTTLLPKSTLPYLAIIAANFGLATVPICVRLAQGEHMPSLTIATLRLLLAAVLLAPYILSRHRDELRSLTRKEMALIGIAGFSSAMFFILYFNALEYTSVLISSVFTSTAPLWVALLEVVVLKGVLRRNLWIGLVLVLLGSALFAISGSGAAVTLGNNPVLGGAMSLIAAVASGAYLIAGRVVRRRLSALVFLWLMLLVAVTVALIFSLLTGTTLTGYGVQGYLWVVVMTLGAQIVAQSSISYSLAHLSPTFVSISTQVSIILSTIVALLLFQEVPQPLQILASLVMLAGVFRVVYTPRPSVQTARA